MNDNMNIKRRRELHVAALYLYARFLAGEKLFHGICHYIIEIDYRRMGILCDLFEKWPYFSGNWECPIPSPEIHSNPEYEYCRARDAGTLWDQKTKYGRMRLDLLKFIIEQTGD